MPAQTALTLTDSVPASRTFAAAGVANGVATWYEKTSAIVGGYFKITMSMRMPTKATEPVRHQLKIVLPTTASEVINTVTYYKIVRQSMIDVVAVVAQDSIPAERYNISEFLSQMCSSSIATLNAENLYNQIYNLDPTT